MRMTQTLLASMMALVLACGGGGQSTKDQNIGDTHATSDDDGDVPLAGRTGDTGDTGDQAPQSRVVFQIVNSGSTQLSFNMNKGWQPVIFAWSGERGRGAKPIEMFARHCTASCDLGEEEICPYCPPPENNKAARAAQKYEHVPAGETLDVPWDGQVFKYEKTRGVTNGKKSRCKCHRMDDPLPEDYTVMVCGMLLTAKANVRSKQQCVEAKMTLPAQQTPMTVSFDFPDPPAGKKKKH